MRLYAIRDICSIKSGKRLPKGDSFAEGETPYPYIRARDIKNGVINGDDLVYISESTHQKLKRYIVRENDVVITIVGASVGDVALVKKSFDGYNLTENAVRLTEFKPIANSRYISLILNTPKYWDLMQRIAGGAAQPKLGIYKIESISFELPTIDRQNRIVEIISAYDNLIENNQKQIKLLEEAAQRLYKQWFIDLKFPGHETTKIIDGLPEGWKSGKIGDIAEFKRGKVITKGDVVEGNVPVVAGGLEPAYYHNASFTESPVITVSGSGANAGFARMYFQKIWASDCSYVDSSATNFIYFTYSFLKENKKSLDSLQKGAAQPHVYAKDINALKLNCPPKDLLVKFEKSVKPLFDKIGKCQNVIEKSKDARNRLLPKLMNNEFI